MASVCAHLSKLLNSGISRGYYKYYNKKGILDKCVLPILRQQFRGGPFLLQYDCIPVCKARAIKTRFVKFDVEEFECPVQSPDLNSTKHLWDELEHQLQASSSCSPSVPDLSNTLLTEWSQVSTDTVENLVESLPKRADSDVATTPQ